MQVIKPKGGNGLPGAKGAMRRKTKGGASAMRQGLPPLGNAQQRDHGRGSGRAPSVPATNGLPAKAVGGRRR